jgi:hypothetical protein
MLLDHASEQEWQHLYLLATIKPTQAELAKLDYKWYTTQILKSMRERYDIATRTLLSGLSSWPL